ncbi:hypothetical protein AB4Y45_34220 [Paraburkholderia sp. EG287A]|uniref:hypothetical protein n=1 Tax=Paraburkholderia sp. EG287A TaxID=3237012 RepID=UPI0034D1C882
MPMAKAGYGLTSASSLVPILERQDTSLVHQYREDNMTYSCTDFADAIQDKLQEVGALHVADKRVEASEDAGADFDAVEAYKDDPGAQATACLNAIDRLVEVRDAAVARRDALIALDTRNDRAPRDPKLLETFLAAEMRLAAALEAVKQPPA